jgi:ankyrin repeat protein
MSYRPSGGDWKELFTAVQQGGLALVEFHLSQGVDPNYQHPEVLTTPLIEAAQLGKTEIVALLLQKGADPRIRSELDGWTAYEVAKAYGHQAVVKLLRPHEETVAKRKLSFWKRWFRKP